MGKGTEMLCEKEYWFWYCSLYRISTGLREALLGAFGSPEEIYRASEKSIEYYLKGRQTGKEGKILELLTKTRKEERIKKAYEEMEKGKIHFVGREERDYPGRLRQIDKSPLGLFLRGRLPEENRPAAAIVGARNCSYYGRQMAKELGAALARAGVQVVSGLARGIDSAGHRGALKGRSANGSDRGAEGEWAPEPGGTYGILGCGPDVIYPPENGALYEQVESAGGIISEYPPGVRPFAANFPARNRIISGLSDCVAVIEAGKRSGSLITASYALDQGKEIWAVPGRAGDYLSQGTNSLLKDGAQVLTEPEDILGFWEIKKRILRIYEKNKISLDKNQEKVYSCLDSEPKSLEEIREETGFTSDVLAGCLLDLEMEGMVMQPFEHYYAAKSDKGDYYGKVSGRCGVPRKSKNN